MTSRKLQGQGQTWRRLSLYISKTGQDSGSVSVEHAQKTT